MPAGLLASHSHRSNFLKGFFTHIGTIYNVVSSGREIVGFNIEHKRKRELIPQIVPILAEYGIFPNLRFYKGRASIIIQDPRELQTLVKRGLLPKRHEAKLKALLERVTPASRRSHTLKDYNDFIQNKQRKEIDRCTAKNWEKRKNAPDQVNRYLKLYKKMSGFGITYKAFPAILAHHRINLLEEQHENKKQTPENSLQKMNVRELVEHLERLAGKNTQLILKRETTKEGDGPQKERRKPPRNSREKAEELMKTAEAAGKVNGVIGSFIRRYPLIDRTLIESAGKDGFSQAALTFDEKIGVPFHKFAELKSKNYIRDAIRQALRRKEKIDEVSLDEIEERQGKNLASERQIVPNQALGALPIKTIQALHNLHKNNVLSETELLALLLSRQYDLQGSEVAERLKIKPYKALQVIKTATEKLKPFQKQLEEKVR